MPDTWHLWRSGPGQPAFNMALDEALLEESERRALPLLRLYGWSEPAATFGYFQKMAHVETATSLRPLIRRPTGGGIVPHDADWTYTIVVPPQHPWHDLRATESYEKIHAWIRDAFRRTEISAELSGEAVQDPGGRCFSGAEKLDVLAGGVKVAGAAQRRNRLGLLIQGSIQPKGLTGDRWIWEEAFLKEGEERLGIQWEDFSPSESLLARARVLGTEKYGTQAFTGRI